MKTYQLFFFIFSASVNVFAISKIPGPTKLDSCAVRISSRPISSSDGEVGAEFCSGSILEDGSMIAFAAHCLNQVMERNSDSLGNNSFEIGFSSKDTTEKFKLKAGEYSIFAGDQLSTVAHRDDFLSSGDFKYVKDDLAIIRLKKPISKMAHCPVLPAPSDCEDFEKKLLTFGKGAGLYVDFFISSEVRPSGSAIKKVTAWYPSKDVVQVQASDLQFSPSTPEVKNLHAPILASFTSEENKVQMRKGDSGSMAYWKQNSKNIFIGVQSATIPGTPDKGYFSQVCKHVGTKKFDDFSKSFNSIEAKLEQPKKSVDGAN